MKIESHQEYYAACRGYIHPHEVEMQTTIPSTTEEHELYATAHCLVSERHGKGDLVNMVYVLLKREGRKDATVAAQAEVIEALDSKLNLCWSDGWLGHKKGTRAHHIEKTARARLAALQGGEVKS